MISTRRWYPSPDFWPFKEAISFISIYGKNGLEYYTSKDGSVGTPLLVELKKTRFYQEVVVRKGVRSGLF